MSIFLNCAMRLQVHDVEVDVKVDVREVRGEDGEDAEQQVREVDA